MMRNPVVFLFSIKQDRFMLVDPVVEIGHYSSVELPVSVADIDLPHGS